MNPAPRPARWALPLLVVAGLAAPSPAAAAASPSPAVRLLILLPKEGSVTDPSTLVRVQAVGQALSATVHFNLVVDDRGVAADGRLTVRSGAAAFFVPAGGGVRTVNLHDLPAGVHALRADPVARPGEPPAAASSVVNFTVGPGTAGTGGHASVPFVIGLLLLGALFLLTMRRVSSYSRSLEHDEGSQPGSDDTDDGSHRGEDGEGGR